MQGMSPTELLAWPTLGLGTWQLGESPAAQASDMRVVREAIDIGYRLIDTAEMYGDGGAERVVGAAVNDALRSGLHRDDLVIVSKFYPHHAAPADLRRACDGSRRRLELDQIDLYLLHWRGSVPLAQTVDTLEALCAKGWIRSWGVSNFDLGDMHELVAVAQGGRCAANQVHYSLGARGAGFDLLPWQCERRMRLMAYSPLDQGELSGSTALRELARKAGRSPADIALAWLTSQPGVTAIPKSARSEHLLANWRAASWSLDDAIRRELDALYPPPTRRTPLSMR